MSAPTAIGMVSESLQNLLAGEKTLPFEVTILAPDETTSHDLSSTLPIHAA